VDKRFAMMPVSFVFRRTTFSQRFLFPSGHLHSRLALFRIIRMFRGFLLPLHQYRQLRQFQ
jgi:hypothetical protein